MRHDPSSPAGTGTSAGGKTGYFAGGRNRILSDFPGRQKLPFNQSQTVSVCKVIHAH